jgi:hypothetical protein
VTTIKWPAGPASLYASIYYRRNDLLDGVVLAIDPSSGSKTSQPGFAVYYKGAIQSSGTIEIPHADINIRLQTLYRKIRGLLPVSPDVLLIEQIGGKAHHMLLEAVGVSIVAADTPTTIRVHNKFWKAYAAAHPDYEKGDAADARMIGDSVLAAAREFANGNHAVFPGAALTSIRTTSAPRGRRVKVD